TAESTSADQEQFDHVEQAMEAEKVLDNEISSCVKEAVEEYGLTVDEANQIIHIMIGAVSKTNIVIDDLRIAFVKAAEEKAKAVDKADIPPEKPKTEDSEKKKPSKPNVPIRKRK
ncbi:hypothetical protein LCGC14_1447010, partial [marine sediment metagenome]